MCVVCLLACVCAAFAIHDGLLMLALAIATCGQGEAARRAAAAAEAEQEAAEAAAEAEGDGGADLGAPKERDELLLASRFVHRDDDMAQEQRLKVRSPDPYAA